MRDTIRALDDGKIIVFEGVRLRKVAGEIRPGDTYIAERNTGPKLLTCHKIGDACIHPIEPGYSFDTWECVKVEMVEDE